MESKRICIYSCYESGVLKVRDFCANEVINEAKFYYWQKKLRQSKQLLSEEQEEACLAEKKITLYKARTVTTKEKSKPVRKPIPANILRIEEHIYLANINLREWIELEPEITEIFELKPEEFFIRRVIRYKYVLRNKSVQEESHSYCRSSSPAFSQKLCGR